MNLGEGLIATYQGKLDHDMLAVMNKSGIERNGVDATVRPTLCLRLTSDGIKEYGDLLVWYDDPLDAILAFTNEFLAYLVRIRMMDGETTRELIWKRAPSITYSTDGWAVVSWIRRVLYTGVVDSGEFSDKWDKFIQGGVLNMP